MKVCCVKVLGDIIILEKFKQVAHFRTVMSPQHLIGAYSRM